MNILNLFTLVIIVILFFINKDKTLKGIKKGFQNLLKKIPVFINMIILVSISLFFISDGVIVKYLGHDSGLKGVFLASILGSISFVPGFVVFPLSGVLLEKGVSYMTIAAFTTTLMMVGILTYPLEKEFFGTKITIIRNSMSFIIALLVAILVGIFYKELLI